jgi:hypothetical protein
LPLYTLVGELSLSADIDALDEEQAKQFLQERLQNALLIYQGANSEALYISDEPEWLEIEEATN